MTRTAIYIRVSTDRQAQEGDSIAAQRDALHAYINARSTLVLCGEYVDDGISGQKWEQREALQSLLADVQAGMVDLILCTKMDRLHRSLKNFLTMQEILTKHNVQWLAIWEPMYDTSTPAGQLIINQMMSFAQFEAQNTGSRIRQVMEYKVSQGQAVTGNCPCGYQIVNKRLEPDALAPYVREAFETFLRTESLSAVAGYCNSCPGLPRTVASVKRMLCNKKYMGEHRGNPNYCTPIVSRETFEAVQRRLEFGHRNTAKYSYLFSGLIRCGTCGWIMIGLPHGGKKYSYPTYRCNGHYCYPKDCPVSSIVFESSLERYLLAHIRPMMEEYVLECHESAAVVVDNTKRVDAVKKKLDKLKELYLNDLISLDEYKVDKNRLENEMASILRESAPKSPDTSSVEDLLAKPFEGLYGAFSCEEKRFFWVSIIQEIRFVRKGTFEVTFL